MALLSTTPVRPIFRSLTVAEVEPVADHAVSVAFDVTDPKLSHYLDYRAGQYVTLDAAIEDERVRQSYSLWTRPAMARAEGLLRIAVAEVSGGRMSPWLASHVTTGDTIDVLAPRGDFTYAVGSVPEGGSRHAVVAGGSGITPVLAIAAEILADEVLERGGPRAGQPHSGEFGPAGRGGAVGDRQRRPPARDGCAQS